MTKETQDNHEELQNEHKRRKTNTSGCKMTTKRLERTSKRCTYKDANPQRHKMMIKERQNDHKVR